MSSTLKKKLTRREAIGTAAKVATGAVIAGVLGGVAGYYAGSTTAARPATTIERTVTTTVAAAERTVTQTVTAPATTVTLPASTVTVTETVAAKPTGAITAYMVAEPGPEALKNIIGLFTRKTGIDVTLEVYPYATLQTKQATIAAAKSEAVDVYYVDDVWLGQYYESGWVEPIDELIERDKEEVLIDDFPKGLQEGNMRYAGHWIGLGHISAIYIFYYRTDILEQFGYSEKDLDTYEGVYEVAKAMKPDLEKKGMYPIGLMGARGVQATCCYYHFLGTFGGRVYDPETYKPEINSPEAIEALEFEAKLAKEVGIPSIPSDDYGELQSNFLTGKIAMMPAWHNMAPVLLRPDSPVRGKWRGIPVPKAVRRAPTLGGWCMALSKFSKKKDLAWEFIKWAASPSVCTYLSQYQDMSRYSSFAWPEKACYASASMAMLEIAWPRPNIPPWPAMSDLMGIAVNKVLAGETTAKAALDDLQKKYEEILRSAGYYKG
jgi:multiple sugar transport system substrate-binding protein